MFIVHKSNSINVYRTETQWYKKGTGFDLNADLKAAIKNKFFNETHIRQSGDQTIRGKLFKRLPKEVQEILSGNEEKMIYSSIDSSATSVPFELLYDGKKYIG